VITGTMRGFIATTVLAAVAGCSEPTVTPDSDSLSVAAAKIGADRVLAIALTAATTGDAGLIFSIEGPNILDVVPAAGYEIVKSQTDAGGRSSFNVLLIGPLQSGPVAYAMVKGVNSGTPYTATVTQVAAGATDNYAQRTDLGSYRLTVTAPR
jgi:hypothetical protein